MDPVTAPLGSTPPQPTAVEERYGNALLKRPLGRGGMGEVFLGFHEGFGIPVAVKLLPEAFRETELVDRFLREAQVSVRLDHPHIVRVHDVGRAHGRVYMIMEYIEGEDLERYASDRGGRLSIAEALRVVGEAAEAVAYAHAQGVIHRDLKPANLMRRAKDGAVKVLDFGLARGLGFDQLTNDSRVMGTLPYMAPEQLLGRSGPPADVYSLGVTLYRLIAGKLPFLGSIEETLRFHREGACPPLSSFRATPRAVEALAARLLAKSAEERPTAAESAARIAETLRGLSGEDVEVAPATPLTGAGRLAGDLLREMPSPLPRPAAPAPTPEPISPMGRTSDARGARQLLWPVAILAAAILILGGGVGMHAWRQKLREGSERGAIRPTPPVARLEVSAAMLVAPDGLRSMATKDLTEMKLAGAAGPEFLPAELRSGEALRFVLRAEEPLHVYIFNVDTAGTVACLFPDFYAMQHAKLEKEGQVAGQAPTNPMAPELGMIVIPPVTPTPQRERMARWFTADGSEGTEWFLIAVGRTAIPELEAIRGASDLAGRGAELKAFAARLGRAGGDAPPAALDLSFAMIERERVVPPGLVPRRGADRVVWTCELTHKP